MGPIWDDFILNLPLLPEKIVEVSFQITSIPEVESDSLPILAEIMPSKDLVIQMAVRTAKKNVLIRIQKSFLDTPYFDKIVVKTSEKIFEEYLAQFQGEQQNPNRQPLTTE